MRYVSIRGSVVTVLNTVPSTKTKITHNKLIICKPAQYRD